VPRRQAKVADKLSRIGRTLHQRTRHGPAGVLYSDALSGPLRRRRKDSHRVHGRRRKMDRGVIVGGGLIAASFLVAVLLNRSAHEEGAPAKREPPARACADPGPRPPGRGALPDSAGECERLRVESPPRWQRRANV